MTLRTIAHQAAIKGERFVDRLLPAQSGDPVLEAYRGYATPDSYVLRGRVLTALRRSAPDPEHSKWTNARQMLSLFFTDEVQGVEVRAMEAGVVARSDEEGYLTLEIPRDPAEVPGWRDVPMRVVHDASVPVSCPVLIPDPDARFGVISDVDDTMMRTGAYSLARNLWTTFTGSALSREIFADSIALMKALHEQAKAPVYYVSSSPWNLHHFLDRVFARAGLVAGPMFLRDLGISETQFVTGTHGDHKGDAIDRILAANPTLSFVLMGDTGQHDAEIYHAAIERHPGRIRAVVLRQPGPGPDIDAKKAMRRIEETRVPLYSGKTFDGFAEPLLATD